MLMSPRLRRLMLDHERLQRRFGDWPLIRIEEAAGTPPERYRFEFLVTGLETSGAGSIQERNHHLVEIQLSLGYPRRMPQCKILTPIFHPNFDQTSICIGDFWAASEGLDDLVVRIARMIAYQEYNTKSPLNGLAAKWAAENQALLPVDRREMGPPGLAEAESAPGEPVHISGVEVPDFGSQAEAVNSSTPGATDGRAAKSPPAERTPTAAQTQSVDELVNLAPELSLLHLRVRCDRCKCVFDLELPALRAPVACPQCQFRHEGGRTYKCLAVESAGLFWFQDTDT